MHSITSCLTSLASCDSRAFDILKIILDKGLLALLLILAGLIGSFLLERYKSVLKRQEELTKIDLPNIINMMEQAENILECAYYTLNTLSVQFNSFKMWAEAIHFSQATIIYDPDVPFTLKPTPDDLKRLVQHPDWGSLTIAELLARTAPDELVRNILNDTEFALNDTLYESGGFFSFVQSTLMKTPSERKPHDLTLLCYAVARTVFVPSIKEPRNTFAETTRRFRFSMMRSLPLESRKQKRVYKNLELAVNTIDHVITNFPATEYHVVQPAPPPAFAIINTGYASIISQLRLILRTNESVG